MKLLVAGLLIVLCGFLGVVAGATAPAKTTSKSTQARKPTSKATRRKSTAAAKVVRRSAPVSAAARAAARLEIDQKIAALDVGVENPAALAGYFAALDHAKEAGKPVHVLQFGDSHTASDDWVNTMRTAAQALYGDGGPGYIHVGHPYLGYRRFDALGANSAEWKTDGNKSHQADQDQGLSHISVSTSAPGQTIRLTASGESLGIFYMLQPGGGQFELTFDGGTKAVVSTSGDEGPGYFSQVLGPGQHEVTLRTMNFAPVRLFGWTLDNDKGITFETLGINGALASKILDANEQIWAAELSERAPALVILAYGTNEAISRVWTREQYVADLTEVIARIRRATPNASILMVGPPDCGRLQPLLHLSEVIDMQREVAGQQGAAFWDWRMHMGGAGMVDKWVLAGLGQADHIHLTTEGYRLIGNMLFAQMEKAHSEVRHE